MESRADLHMMPLDLRSTINQHFIYNHDNTPPYSPDSTQMIESQYVEKRTYADIHEEVDLQLERAKKEPKLMDDYAMANLLRLEQLEAERIAREAPHLIMPSYPHIPLTARSLASILNSQIATMSRNAEMSNSWQQFNVIDEHTAHMAWETPHLVMPSNPQIPLTPRNLALILHDQMQAFEWKKKYLQL